LSSGDWLVVVDGLAEPDAALELLPGGGPVIVTSQHHSGWRMIGATPSPASASFA